MTSFKDFSEAPPVESIRIDNLGEKTSGQDTQVLIDVTDLISYFYRSRIPTGIQRVVMSLGRAALERDADAIVYDDARDRWLRLPRDTTKALLDLCIVETAITQGWRDALRDLDISLRSAPIVSFSSSSLFLSLGANWGGLDALRSIKALRRRHGLRCVFFLHDTVPLDFPEYCHGDTSRRFRDWFYVAIDSADALIVNSEWTGTCVTRACGDARIPCPPLVTCRLDAQADPNWNVPCPSPKISAILRQRHVLCVSTIEPRKNHLATISAWRTIVRQLGDETPLLVLAGTLGWDYGAVMKALEDPILHRKVTFVSCISEDDLSALYRTCMFTIYNSHAEGWGLPVSESISHGKLPVVPEHSGLIESGAGCAEFFSSSEPDSLARTLLRLLRDQDYLALRTGICADVGPRRWSDVTRDLLVDLDRAFAWTRPALPAALTTGHIYHFIDPPPGRPLTAYLDAAAVEGCFGTGWHRRENWGTWTSRATFEFTARLKNASPDACLVSVDGSLGSDLEIILATRGHLCDCELTFTAGDGVDLGRYESRAGRELIIVLRWPRSLGPVVCLRVGQSALTDLGKSESEDTRVIGIGVMAILIGACDDHRQRCRFYEHFLHVAHSTSATCGD